MKVFFERREELAPGIWQYFFRPEQAVDFIPGQYAAFHVPDRLNDPRGQSRVFTMTSLPTDELVSFVVKFVEPLSPYKQALQQLQPHYELRMDEAMGDLVLPKLTSIPLVFIAGGIGIASFVSMVNSGVDERNVRLLYTVHSADEIIFTGIAGQLQSDIFIAPNRVTTEAITKNQAPDTQYYLSGSERFVEGLRRDLQDLGILHEQIVFDYFDGYTEL